jgi:hypothetical protein
VGTDEVGAFFGRLVAAVDVHPELEARLAAADPFTRYAIFLADVVGRFRASADLRALNSRVWTLLLAEEIQMQRDHPEAWRPALAILEDARARG